MEAVHRRARHVVALGTAVAVMLLVWCPRAFALNPALDVSQYAHTAWKIRDGFSSGIINAIAQTPDGYLWLGTDRGLLRFDGIRTMPWQPPADQPLPSSTVLSLLAARDGTLWIGTDRGLAGWKDGKLIPYKELAGRYVFKLLEDRDGSVWTTVLVSSKRTLCAVQHGRVQCYGEDGGAGAGAIGVHEDSKGTLWVGTSAGLWQWKPGPARFYALPYQPNGIQGLADADDGALLISTAGGIRRFVDGDVELMYRLPASLQAIEANRILRDRDGSLWIGTSAGGVVHVHRGIVDVFAQADGLSGDVVSTMFEDREGSVWVATRDGLDRFRDSAAAPFSANQGLSNANVNSVLAASDGSVWVGTFDGLNRWNDRGVTVYRERGVQTTRLRTSRSVREITGLRADGIQAIFQDRRGRVWVSTPRGVGYLEHDRFVSLHGVPGGLTRAIVEDGEANLWIANQELGLFRVSPGRDAVEGIPWARLNHSDAASAMAADPSRGGVWVGFSQGGVLRYTDGRVLESYTPADGLGEGRVKALQLDRDGTLWVSTESGLSRLKSGRVATLTSRNGLPCDAVQWVVEDDARSLWLCMACGLARIERVEIDAWANAVDKNEAVKPLVHAAVFDASDGVRVYTTANYYSSPAVRSLDGTIWFMSPDGLSAIDPDRLPFNRLPPPVHIERITADRQAYDVTSATHRQVQLPALIRDLQIDYTALSLVAPEKMRFRYKLEGRDRDWQDVGTRRQAFYNDLPPGNYRFRVSASNNSGVWNEAGAFVDFAVAPAYYQTAWFGLLAVAAFVGLVGGLYRLRLRQLARYYAIRMEERVSERTRIARDLHDTLLQSFQGVLLKFYAAKQLIPDRPAEARTRLEAAIEQARQAITEGREAVQGLRSSTVVADLAQAISTIGEQLAADHAVPTAPAFRVQVEGTPRPLVPLLQDEVYRIAVEALRNAFRHAHARQVEVELRYDPRQLRLRIRDDGKGIDPHVLGAGGRDGRYGLPGMHERARLAGGKLAVWSELDAGTEAELTIPASAAYVK